MKDYKDFNKAIAEFDFNKAIAEFNAGRPVKAIDRVTGLRGTVATGNMQMDPTGKPLTITYWFQPDLMVVTTGQAAVYELDSCDIKLIFPCPLSDLSDTSLLTGAQSAHLGSR